MIHFLEKYKDIERGMKALAKIIKGKNSVVVFDKYSKNFIGFRQGSPLIVGKGRGVAQIVSDTMAFDKKIEYIYYLNNGEMVRINKKQNIKLFSLLGDKKNEIKWEKFIYKDINSVEGGAMYKELKEGLETMKRIDKEKKLLREFEKEIRNSREVILVGCGSAGVAAEMGANLISTKLKIRAGAYSASEINGYINSFNKDTLIVILSQSGETMDLIEVVEKLLKSNFRVIGLINNSRSTLARMVNKHFPILADKEVAVVATKSFLGMIYWFLKITKTKEKIFYEEKEAIKMAKNLTTIDKLLIIGRGEYLILAKEAAIKLKEACYIQSEAIGGGELKHGTLALIEKGTKVLAIGNNLENDSAEIKARGGKILEINKGGIINDLFFIQLLSFFLAKNRGINPDRPRNLAKSVTVK